MWVLVFYDLPMVTKKQKQQYTEFRKMMLRDGFQRFQFSIYLRHCPSRENAEVHVRRVRQSLPPDGYIGIMIVTDKQFSTMELFRKAKAEVLPAESYQLEMF